MDIVDLYEAENIFREKYPNERLISVVEWKNYYIFNSSPKGISEKIAKFRLTPLRAIDKTNGLIRTFNPLVDGDSTYAKAVKDNILYY